MMKTKGFFCKMTICLATLIGICIFSGCSKGSQSKNIELEDMPWGITMEEVFEIYGVDKDTVTNLIENEYDTYFALENGQEMLVKRHLKSILVF